jgi:hypothetical protein
VPIFDNSKLSNKAFLGTHKYCCLCGGSKPADTIEHAPPIVLFVDGQLPASTHRVPACKRCNLGSSQKDQVAALIAITQASIYTDKYNDYFVKLFDGVKNNNPEVIHYFNFTGNEDVPLSINGNVTSFPIASLDPRLFSDWLDPWAAKQAYALYYLHSGKPLSPTDEVAITYITNSGIIDGNSPDELTNSLTNYGELRQGKKHSRQQYEYMWKLDVEASCFVLLMHDASKVILAISHNPPERFHDKWSVFSTNEEQGIYRLNQS